METLHKLWNWTVDNSARLGLCAAVPAALGHFSILPGAELGYAIAGVLGLLVGQLKISLRK